MAMRSRGVAKQLDAAASANSGATRATTSKATSAFSPTPVTPPPATAVVRRSTRIAENANAPPSLKQLMHMNFQDFYESPVANRAPRHRTRATTKEFRSKYDEEATHVVHDDGGDGDSVRDDDEGDEYVDEPDQDDEEEDMDESMDGNHGQSVGASGRGRGQRRGSGLTEGKQVRVPGPHIVHNSWEEWRAYLREYAAKTHQVLVIEYTTSTKNRNGRIASQKTPQPFVPETIEAYERKYICTHGWRERKRGKGARPSQHIRSLSCPFNFRVQMQLLSGVWKLVVIDNILYHNHVLDRETYQAYPVARGIKNTDTAELTTQLIKHNIGRAQIYNMLLSRGENVFQTDVDNLVNQQRILETGVEDHVATAQVLDQFLTVNDGCAISTYQTPSGETGVVNIASRHMREMFARFGEMLMVDCTHKTNKYNYQLCTFMVMDEYGLGQPVQQSLLETSADWHMERALDHLIETNSASKLVRVIIVDKDLKEIRVLQRRFPEARVLICHFHVKKYLKEVSRDIDFGKLSKPDYKRLDGICHKLVYAPSAQDYQDSYEELKAFCLRSGFEEFCRYMDKNWESTKDMWTLYERAKLPRFKNDTNNRLESWFGKFKDNVDGNSTMATCVQELINSAARAEREYVFQKRLGKQTDSRYDKEMSKVLSFSTVFVAAEVFGQYNHALAKASDYEYELPDGPNGQTVLVKGKSTHRVDLSDWSCDCEFAKSMRLPCRHAMAYRKHLGYREIIPLERIDERWRHETRPPPGVPRYRIVRAPVVPEEQAEKMNRADARARYNEAMRIAQKICSELADVDDPNEFQEYLDCLTQQWKDVRQRRQLTARPVRVSDNEEPEPQRGDRAPTQEDDQDEDELPTQRAEPERDKGVQEEEMPQAHGVGEMPPDHGDPELSQANSLWDESLGNVAFVPAHALQIATPVGVLVAQDCAGQMEVEDTNPSAVAHARDTSPGLAGPIRGEYMAALHAPIGHVLTTAGHVSTTAAVEMHEFNGKAPKDGRPKIVKRVQEAQAKQDRSQVRASMAGARVHGQHTLHGFLDHLDSIAPGLDETRTLLDMVPQTYEECTNKRPKLVSLENPVLVVHDLFRLPSKLLKACVKVFEGKKSTREDPITVHTPTSTASTPTAKATDVVRVAGAADFTRTQIELMNRLSQLEDAVTQGDEFVQWIEGDVMEALTPAQIPSAKALADKMRGLYPLGRIPGVDLSTDTNVATVYKLKPDHWLTDGIIRSFCERLQTVYSSVRYTDLLNAPRLQRKGKKGARVDKFDSLATQVEFMTHDVSVDYVMVPVNLFDTHWVCIIVDTKQRVINTYDSQGKAEPTTRVGNIASAISDKLPDYSITALNSPIQNDSFSCGLFVLMKFWQFADRSVSKVMSFHQLIRRRFEVAHFLITGEKPY